MGVFYAGTVGQNEFFYKVRRLAHSILAREPKLHADWFRNGHATRKNPQMDPKKRFFLKNPPGFLAFEKSSSKLTSNGPIWLKQIYRDIKFILRGLPGRCGASIPSP